MELLQTLRQNPPVERFARLKTRQIRRLLVEQGLKTWWVAEQLGVHKNTLRRWLKGETKVIKATNADKLAELLRVPLPDITEETTIRTKSHFRNLLGGFLFLSLVLPNAQSSPRIDPELAPYVATFMVYWNAHHIRRPGNKPMVKFGDAKGYAGYCKLPSPRNPMSIVTIDRAAWNKVTPHEREMLILHELGHCLLGLKHGSGIMRPVIFQIEYRAPERKFLIEDLFQKERL